MEAGRPGQPRGRDGSRRNGDPDSRGTRAARLDHVRGGGGPDGESGGSLAAAERDRVARLRGHVMHRQDRHAHRAEICL